ncbi:uncharacterized mitochondrial protein AtMg00820-like [Lycium barbarum]|uniref:uncharacterized mitochondrial protein AtMg00820-like n=1 Tax=Lycium barbarum TaxID=112863 RepID=UPI00293E12ED|nr:uncharacterized mitochondrial protein AtMg00820-like [Lycium barbarum]
MDLWGPYKTTTYDGNRISSKYQDYIAAVSTETEPFTYKDAIKDPRWVEAMQQEIAALESNNTWQVTTLPENKIPIGCKWVYRIKYKANGDIERFNARLVAKGYSQKEGIDYQEIFSPIVKMKIVRTVLVTSPINNWHIHQIDVFNAF